MFPVFRHLDHLVWGCQAEEWACHKHGFWYQHRCFVGFSSLPDVPDRPWSSLRFGHSFASSRFQNTWSKYIEATRFEQRVVQSRHFWCPGAIHGQWGRSLVGFSRIGRGDCYLVTNLWLLAATLLAKSWYPTFHSNLISTVEEHKMFIQDWIQVLNLLNFLCLQTDRKCMKLHVEFDGTCMKSIFPSLNSVTRWYIARIVTYTVFLQLLSAIFSNCHEVNRDGEDRNEELLGSRDCKNERA